MNLNLDILHDAVFSPESNLAEENLDMVYILRELRKLDTLVDQFLTKSYLDTIVKRHPETGSYIYRLYGMEAWNVTNNMKAMFERFKNFFKRIFNYISRFAVLRIKAAYSTVSTYSGHISDPNNTAKIDELTEKYTTKDVRVDTIVLVLNRAEKYYTDASAQIEAVKNANENNLSTEGDDVEKIFGELPSKKEYGEAVEKLDKENPNNEETKGSLAVPAKEGGWMDKQKIAGLLKNLDTAQKTFLNLKRLQVSCNSLIADLEKTDQPSSDSKSDNTEAKAQAETKKTVNGKKIEFLRTFSKEILTGVVRTIVNASTTCGKKCKALDSAFTGKPGSEKPTK